MKSEINAVILIGGNSSRMGMDKYALNYFGISQLEYLQSTLKTFFTNIYISCNAKQANGLEQFDNLIIDDNKYGEKGPFTAVLSAFEKLKSSIFVVGCDYPFLDKAEIESLLKERDSNYYATCFENETNGITEPLITIYEFSSFELLLNQYNANDFSLKRFLVNNNVKKILPVNGKSLKSIDTPIDYNYVVREFSLKPTNQ